MAPAPGRSCFREGLLLFFGRHTARKICQVKNGPGAMQFTVMLIKAAEVQSARARQAY